MARWSDDAARAVVPAGLRRREFLDLVALIAALPACKDRKPAPPPGPTSAPEPTPEKALDATSYRALDAATARILPADGTFPGAREANVMEFIDRQLAIAPLTKIAPAMIAIAHAFDDAARARPRVTDPSGRHSGAAGSAGNFAALAPAQQDEVLEALSRGALGTKLPERELFRVLHGLTLEGFLADPQHGGNKDQVAWRAIGFAEPPLRKPGGKHGHGG